MIKALLLCTALAALFVASSGESCDVGPCSFDMYLHKYLERSEAVRALRAQQQRAAAAKDDDGDKKDERFAFDSAEGVDEFGQFRERFAQRGGQKAFARTGQQKFAFAEKAPEQEVKSHFDVDVEM